jgi:hypothetical protein
VWGPVFLAMAIGISIALHILVFLTTGLSASSDVVFGSEALVSGIASFLILRKTMRLELVPFEKLRISFLWIWIPLCLYVILVQPF